MLKWVFEYLIFRFGLVLKIFRFLIICLFGFFKIIRYIFGFLGWVGIEFYLVFEFKKKKLIKINLII